MNGAIFQRMRPLASVVIGAALATTALVASAGERPLADWLSRQQTWCAALDAEGFFDCANSYYGGPDCANGGFIFPALVSWGDPKTGVTANIDSFGAADAQFFGGRLGTTLDGSVADGAAPGGRAKVNVTLHTTNALSRAFDVDGNALFGYFIDEVLNGAPPTLGESFVRISFTNTAPGAPLPDFAQMQICPLPGQGLDVFASRAQASGPLREAFGVPEGTAGRMEVTQTGLIGASTRANARSRVAFDAFPAEKIVIRPTGQ